MVTMGTNMIEDSNKDWSRISSQDSCIEEGTYRRLGNGVLILEPLSATKSLSAPVSASQTTSRSPSPNSENQSFADMASQPGDTTLKRVRHASKSKKKNRSSKSVDDEVLPHDYYNEVNIDEKVEEAHKMVNTTNSYANLEAAEAEKTSHKSMVNTFNDKIPTFNNDAFSVINKKFSNAKKMVTDQMKGNFKDPLANQGYVTPNSRKESVDTILKNGLSNPSYSDNSAKHFDPKNELPDKNLNNGFSNPSYSNSAPKHFGTVAQSKKSNILSNLKFFSTKLKSSSRPKLFDVTFERPESLVNDVTDLESQINLQAYELISEQIKLGAIIGQGNFGCVYHATLNAYPYEVTEKGIPLQKAVAVKRPKSGQTKHDLKMLFDELKIMINIGRHVNVVSLIGAISNKVNSGELIMVVELCEFGSLLDYLKINREKYINSVKNRVNKVFGQNLTTQFKNVEKETRFSTADLLSFSYQVSNGMDFLSNKKLIHRDLAARNLLVTSEQIIKIGDFGLARQNDVYEVSNPDTPLPAKWMALEFFETFKFTPKCDIWSFGVVLWEVFSLGDIPYGGRPYDQTFLHFLKEGNRMEQTKYSLMLNCWAANPVLRPTFAELRKQLGKQLKRCSKTAFNKTCDKLLQNQSQQNDYSIWLPKTTNDSSVKEKAQAKLSLFKKSNAY